MQQVPTHDTEPFEHIHFILTKRCQLRCRHCAMTVASTSKNSRGLQTADILDMVHHSIQCGATDFVLSGGEPFLHSDVIKIAGYILDSGASTCVIGTNCLHISDRYVEQLADLQAQYSGLQLRISLDGASPKSHDYLRGKNSFDRTMNTAHKLIRGGVTIHGINTVLTMSNYLELEPLFAIAQHLDVVDLTLIDLLAIGRGTDIANLSLGYNEWRRVFAFQSSKKHNNHLWVNVRGPFNYKLMTSFNLEYAPISFNTLYIEPTGDLILCYPYDAPQNTTPKIDSSIEQRWQHAYAIAGKLARTECPPCPYRALCHGIIPKTAMQL